MLMRFYPILSQNWRRFIDNRLRVEALEPMSGGLKKKKPQGPTFIFLDKMGPTMSFCSHYGPWWSHCMCFCANCSCMGALLCLLIYCSVPGLWAT